MALHKKVDLPDEPDVDINLIYVQEAGHEVPMHTMPRGGMLPGTALQAVRDELILDGNPRLNLATFVTTWMEPQAEALIAGCLGKNMIDNLAGGGPDLPIHVDAASGGFIAPFLHPDLVWDFRLPRVASINASGHKYGLVYPGVGWVVWRDPQALPEDLVFNVNYLGGQMPTFALNFSRSGAQVIAQYYNFLRLGFEGYRRVQQACQDVALHLSSQIAGMGQFELLTDGSELPVFAFKLAVDQAGYSVFDLSERLRTRGWLVPAYTLPENLTGTAVMRIVVRNGFSRDLADVFLADLRRHSRALAEHPRAHTPLAPEPLRPGFAH
jgi:glutamate decarboxylase